MSYVLRDTVVRLEPRRKDPRPVVTRFSGVRAAMSRLRSRGGPTHHRARLPADSGVTPFTGAASRGVAFLVRR